MTLFDYAVLALVACSVLLGLWRGLASELLALAAWVLAFFAAREAAYPVGSLAAPWLKEPALQLVAGFLLVFILVLVAVALVRLAVRHLLSAIGLGLADRFLGSAFGIARGLAVALGLVLLGGLTALPQQPWWRDAQLAPWLETAVLASRPWLPQALARRIRYR